MRTAVRTIRLFAATSCAILIGALTPPVAAQTEPDVVGSPRAEIRYEEQESADPDTKNDEQQDGEAIEGFGSGPDETAYARVIGTLSEDRPAPAAGRSTEEDGSIGLANEVELDDGPVLYDGVIGDSVFASSGDFDHFAVFVSEGESLHAWTDTTGIEDPVDSVISVYDPEGELVVTNDDARRRDLDDDPSDADDVADRIDSEVEFEAETSGVFSIAVGGCCLPQIDPKRAGSGAGPGSTGPYQLLIETLSSSEENFDSDVVFGEEDDGSIPSANRLRMTTPGQVTIESVIGDGPFGDTSGDVDFYALGELEADTMIEVVYDDGTLEGDDELLVVFWDEDGFLFDGYPLSEEDPFYYAYAPWDGEYYISVTICCGLPEDPFDSESVIDAELTVADYRVVVTTSEGYGFDDMNVPTGDVDFYLIDLEVGDVVSAGFAGAVEFVEIYDPVGVLRMGSEINPTPLYPASSPLRHQGTVGADAVAGRNGVHAIAVSGRPGSYRGELRVAKASTEPQTIFLDFDGETLDRSLFSDIGGTFTVSPFEDFLFRWDLGPSDADATITAAVASVAENFETIGGVPTEMVLLNSLTDPDPGYVDGVTRIVVGGSIPESAIQTIGIAETIDPGNLDRDEVGLVLLDILSEGRPTGSTLNDVERADGVTMVDLVGLGVGTVISHEIGHLIGVWHTQGGNKVDSLMDGGLRLNEAIGVGPDLVFGTDDDVDVDFAIDEFDYWEFNGYEDVIARARIGLGAFSPDEDIRSPEPERTPPGEEDVSTDSRSDDCEDDECFGDCEEDECFDDDRDRGPDADTDERPGREDSDSDDADTRDADDDEDDVDGSDEDDSDDDRDDGRPGDPRDPELPDPIPGRPVT